MDMGSSSSKSLSSTPPPTAQESTRLTSARPCCSSSLSARQPFHRASNQQLVLRCGWTSLAIKES
ncbi:hypothetical protein PtA15_7A235 [Puccinia triticina]|uniref:Uncharacterized protein n=1 Tax=Puccinia triticina TaxID=208348 RepID=A0ABY7CMV7_9BASI|nr:uncharacterized protein PtA15_7A235 [Puccinia triticina]WAQ86509.1 hypothetical protein PtA15_7A235 [Puccinia triticina]